MVFLVYIPVWKVTESEEVKRRLGSEDIEIERRYQEMYANTPGTGVVDKLKGMVGSWITNPVENQSLKGISPTCFSTTFFFYFYTHIIIIVSEFLSCWFWQVPL